jgi:hypothetical protein
MNDVVTSGPLSPVHQHNVAVDDKVATAKQEGYAEVPKHFCRQGILH